MKWLVIHPPHEFKNDHTMDLFGGAGEMTGHLRVGIALTVDLKSVPSTQVQWLIAFHKPCTSSILGSLHKHGYIHIHTETHMYTQSKVNIFK